MAVSPDQKVTAIAIDYALPGCSGKSTFSNLSLEIGRPPAPPIGNPRGPLPGATESSFFYASEALEAPGHVQIFGSFTSSTSANGYALFSNYQGCGNGIMIWSATRR